MINKLTSLLSFFRRVIAIGIFSVITGFLLIVFSYSFSIDLIDKNVEKSAVTFSNESTHPSVTSTHQGILDNYTDSLMLLEASNRSNESTIRQSMENNYDVVSSSSNPDEVLVNHYINNEAFESTVSYSRYWHGYLLFLKPLLVLTDYSGIRILNFGLQFFLVCLIVYLFHRRKSPFYAIPFLIMVILLSPITTAMSLQYSACYYIILFAFAILLYKEYSYFKTYISLFAAFGILTSFFDFLTYPLATLCLPLILYFSLTYSSNIKRVFVKALSLCISWLIGYIGMWASKWILSSIILRENIVSDAVNTLLFRSSSDSFSRAEVIAANYVEFFKNTLIIIFFVFMIVTLTIIIKRRKLIKREYLKYISIYLIISITPIAWYFVTANHSGIHFFFTNRLVIVTVFSFLCLNSKLLQLIYKKDMKKKSHVIIRTKKLRANNKTT